ncbi:MAG: hypothetical protein Q9200_004613, partial [Gallowayella weberi]
MTTGLKHMAGQLFNTDMLGPISWIRGNVLQKTTRFRILLKILFNNDVALGAEGLNGLVISRRGMSQMLGTILQDVGWADQVLELSKLTTDRDPRSRHSKRSKSRHVTFSTNETFDDRVENTPDVAPNVGIRTETSSADALELSSLIPSAFPTSSINPTATQPTHIQSALSREDFDLFEQEMSQNTRGPAESIAKIQVDSDPLLELLAIDESEPGPSIPPPTTNARPRISTKSTDVPACASPWQIESRGILGNANHPCPGSPPTASPQVTQHHLSPLKPFVGNLLARPHGQHRPRPSASPLPDTAEGQLSQLLSDFGLDSCYPESRGGSTCTTFEEMFCIPAEVLRRQQEERTQVEASRGAAPALPSTPACRPSKLNKAGQQWARLLAYGAVQECPIGALRTNEPTKSALLHNRRPIGAIVAFSGQGSQKAGRPRHSRPTTPLNAQTRLKPQAIQPPSASAIKEEKLSQPSVTPVPEQVQPVTTIKDDPKPDVVSEASSTATGEIAAKSDVEPRPSAPSIEQMTPARLEEDTIPNAAATNVPMPEKKSNFKLLVWQPPRVARREQPPPAATVDDHTMPDAGSSVPSAGKEESHAKVHADTTSCVPTTAQGPPDATARDDRIPDAEVTEPAKPVADTLPATPSSAPATEPLLKPDVPSEEPSPSGSDQAPPAMSAEGAPVPGVEGTSATEQAPQAATVEDPPVEDAVDESSPANLCKLKLTIKPRDPASTEDQVPPSTSPPKDPETAGQTIPGPQADSTPTPDSSPYEEPDMMDFAFDNDSGDEVDANGDFKMTDAGSDSGYSSNEDPSNPSWWAGDCCDMDVDTDVDSDPMEIDRDPPRVHFDEHMDIDEDSPRENPSELGWQAKVRSGNPAFELSSRTPNDAKPSE